MTNSVLCQDDQLNGDFAVIVNDKIATTFPYTSWYIPHGNSKTSAQAAAENLTINLSAVFASNTNSFVVDVDNNGKGVDDNGKGYDVLVNDKVVTTYYYSKVWVVGGLISSKISAMANAYQLGLNLSSIIGAAYHQSK